MSPAEPCAHQHRRGEFRKTGPDLQSVRPRAPAQPPPGPVSNSFVASDGGWWPQVTPEAPGARVNTSYVSISGQNLTELALRSKIQSGNRSFAFAKMASKLFWVSTFLTIFARFYSGYFPLYSIQTHKKINWLVFLLRKIFYHHVFAGPQKVNYDVIPTLKNSLWSIIEA